MPKSPADYFRYVPVPRNALSWGLAVSAGGRTHVPPGSSYPPAKHPDAHALDWSRGRVLETLQVVLITSGRGKLEVEKSKPRLIEAGDAFMLFPGVWHRYQPDPAVGWDESWVELIGPVVDRLLQERFFTSQNPILRVDKALRLEGALDAVHLRLPTAKLGLDPELASRGFGVLAAWKDAEILPSYETRMNKAIELAERHLAEHAAQPGNLTALAKRLGIAYSHFRHAFRLQTGYSPWQYVIRLRLSEGKRMLAGSDATLDEVAARTGFNSAFHFSATFKRSFGISPAYWRERVTKKAARPDRKGRPETGPMEPGR
jgi:AraC-like DNA-binding protein